MKYGLQVLVASRSLVLTGWLLSAAMSQAQVSDVADPVVSQTTVLSLATAVHSAQANDPWLLGNHHAQSAIESMSVAAGSLPDPMVSLSLANLPSDTADFGQEGMTQFKLGIAQMFPRGDSLAIKRRQLQQMGQQYPHQRQDRRAKLVVAVAQQWLNAYRAQESIALIEHDWALFAQLADVAEASYSAALGKTRQQDFIRAQLELTRLNDRLTMLNQQRDQALQRLNEWRSRYFVPSANGALEQPDYGLESSPAALSLQLDRNLPNIQLLRPELYLGSTEPQQLYQYLAEHPAVQGLEQKIEASRTGIELARQKYKPEWGLSASYGYRDQDPMGNERADLFSVGVSFDVPLFTANKQDREVQSAVSSSEAISTEKWLLLRKMMAAFETRKAQLLRLEQRHRLYRQQLLPQMHELAEASLTAYTHDDGDFAEVVRARIAELNANIDALGIDVERQQARAELNYFFMTKPNQIIAEHVIASHDGTDALENHHE